MEFKSLPKNPNPNPNSFHLLSLLDTMENKDLNQSTVSPDHHHSSKSSNHHKKQKQNHPSNPPSHVSHSSGLSKPPFKQPFNTVLPPAQPSRPFGQSSFSKTPYAKPIFHGHSSDPNKYVSYKNKNYPRVPQLVNLSNAGKISKMMQNYQPGMMVCAPQKGEVHSIFMASKWDNFIFYRGQNYHVYLMGEFYANLITNKDQHGLFTLQTVINKRTIQVDVNTITQALKMDPNNVTQPCINIFEKFVFCQKEFEMYVGFFCDCDVPLALCTNNVGIHVKHFTPIYQQLAIIIRANLLPKPKGEQFFEFVDLKVMFQLVTNKIEFNINYVIILNMFIAYQLDYMPYGLLLTAIFEKFYIHMPRSFAERAEYCMIESLVQQQVPLNVCKPYRYTTVLGNAEVLTHDYKRENDIFRLVISDLKSKMLEYTAEATIVKNENSEMKVKISEMESKIESLLVNFAKENNVSSKLEDEEMIQELATVVTGQAGLDDLPLLSEFDATLGFVEAVKLATEE